MHVLALTVLSNLGKMFPAFCYRREAHWRERLALAIGMWPRGEVGAGVLVLEGAERARARGAEIVAELAGFGMSSDAVDMLRPDVEGPVRAMRAALEDARVSVEQVGHINAHGSGTRANDATEARAIVRVFGERSGKIAVTSTKAVHGHALGATGALEAIATAQAVRNGLVPPIANYLGRDPECDLDLVTGRPRRMSIHVALSNSLAFGGLNAVLAFRAPR